MSGAVDNVASETLITRHRGTPQKYKRVPAIEMINDAAATDWNLLAQCNIASSPQKVTRNTEDIFSSVTHSLWAYIKPQTEQSSSGLTKQRVMATRSRTSENALTSFPLKQMTKSSPTRKTDGGASVNGFDLLFSDLNGKSQLFSFGDDCTNLKFKRTLDDCDIGAGIDRMGSQYSTTTLADCEGRSPYYAASVGSDFSYDLEDSKQIVSDLALRGQLRTPMEHLRYKCERFFDHHGLVVKVRQLPAKGGVPKINGSVNYGEKKAMLNYPAYHFVTRQRNHIFEQLMRSRTFVHTRYNSCNETRNSKSPFSLIELHDGILKRVEGLRDDLCNPDFSGIYVSISTKAFESDSEFGRVRRCKTIAWALIELLKTNERCLKGLWVHPTMSAPATTALLCALLPYTIVSSFSHVPRNVDDSYPFKTFCAWLSDFDAFPRQALTLLSSCHRLGLVKHYHVQSDEVGSGVVGASGDVSYKNSKLSHVDAGVNDESCYCHSKADWDKTDRVILSCTEQLVHSVLPQWEKMIPEERIETLSDDIERIITADTVTYNPVKRKDSPNVVRDAEFSGLSPVHVRDLLVHLYGARWKNRVKLTAIKALKGEPVATTLCKQEAITALNEREERRKRRALFVSQTY